MRKVLLSADVAIGECFSRVSGNVARNIPSSADLIAEVIAASLHWLRWTEHSFHNFEDLPALLDPGLVRSDPAAE